MMTKHFLWKETWKNTILKQFKMLKGRDNIDIDSAMFSRYEISTNRKCLRYRHQCIFYSFLIY